MTNEQVTNAAREMFQLSGLAQPTKIQMLQARAALFQGGHGLGNPVPVQISEDKKRATFIYGLAN